MNNYFYGEAQTQGSPKIAENVANGVVFPSTPVTTVVFVPGRITSIQRSNPATVDFD